MPSLSSSPTSPNSIDDLPYSPTASIPGVETYSLHLDDDKPLSRPPQQPPRTRRNSDRGRLSRTLPDVLRCTTCGTDVAYGLQVVSKGFTGRHGRALLVSAPLPSSTPSCPGPPLTGFGFSSSSSPSPAPAPNPSSYSSLARDGANLVNVSVGSPEKRSLVTGIHVVADITCATCGVKIGWKYVDAREQAQKYKVGKFILETERVSLHRTWEDVEQAGPGASRLAAPHFYSSSAPAESFSTPGGRRASGLGGARRKVSCSSEEAGGLADGGSLDEEMEEDGSPAQSDGEVMFDSEDEDECEDIFAGTWDAATVARRRGSRVSGGYPNAAKRGGGRR